jgi:hypothetical protein
MERKLGKNEIQVLMMLDGKSGLTMTQYKRYKGDTVSTQSLMRKGYVDRYKFLNHITRRENYGYHLTAKGKKFIEMYYHQLNHDNYDLPAAYGVSDSRENAKHTGYGKRDEYGGL